MSKNKKNDNELKEYRKTCDVKNPVKKQPFMSRDLITEEHKIRLQVLLKKNPELEPIISIFLGN